MKPPLRIALVFGLVALGNLALPNAAAAHAVDIEYRFPVPVWLYALAGGAAVLASVPAAALGLRSGREQTSGNLYPHLRQLRLGLVGLMVATVLLLVALAGGLFGAQSFFENPASILILGDFWVGLGIVSVLVANVWDFVSPLSVLGRALERALGGRGVAVSAYPQWLGLWPAFALLLVWTWVELIWASDDPRYLALLALAYIGLQLIGMATFGAEMWLARGELFTIVARTLARFAPLELYVRQPAGPCAAERCVEDERIGCPACWLAASPKDRGVRLRPYGAGIRREPPLGPGGGTFVLALLATVVYDGFARTEKYLDLEAYLLGQSEWLAFHFRLLTTLIMVAIAVTFALAFPAVAALVARPEQSGLAATARRYAPTLIPIAAVYFVSHYFVYLIYIAQFTPAVVLDPFEREWIPDYEIWTGIPGSLVWYVQVALIVWGHVVAVFEAHRLSGGLYRGPARAVAAQAPLILLMVGYTFGGLWVLGQVLRAP